MYKTEEDEWLVGTQTMGKKLKGDATFGVCTKRRKMNGL